MSIFYFSAFNRQLMNRICLLKEMYWIYLEEAKTDICDNKKV